MFPLRDHNPSGATPYVTWALMAVNIAVFLGQKFLLPPGNAQDYFVFQWGMTSARLSAGQGWETLLTYMFLHGGWLHLAGNMLFLWIFGDNMEDRFGRMRFLTFYLACGVAAAGVQYLSDRTFSGPMVGASGAIAGILGGYFVLFPKARVDVLFIFVIFFKIFPLPAWIVLGLWMALQLFSGINGAQDGVAYWAHIGGFAYGFGLCLPVALKQRNEAPRYARSNLPVVPRKR